MNSTQSLRALLLCALSLLLASRCVVAQTGTMRAGIGAEAGLATYLGTFGSSTPGASSEVFARLNVVPPFSIILSGSYASLGYDVDATAVANYPEYFGAPSASSYPSATDVARTATNRTTAVGLSVLLTYNLNSNGRFVPFAFAGAGVLSFDPKNADGVRLPNNRAGVYPAMALQVPFGLGAEYYIGERFSVNLRLTATATTGWLDDFDPPDGGNDFYASARAGFTWYFYGTLDCDRDGLTDEEEKSIGTDPCNADTDGDGLSDFEEVRTIGTSPIRSDTDGDGLSDRDELKVYATDPRDPDSDADGIVDGEEIQRRTDPLKADTDGDGVSDGLEVHQYGTDPLASDTDGDGLTDGEEVNRYHTEPRNPDTDSDRLSDGEEVHSSGTDPLKVDTDGDELIDGAEVNNYGTDPLKADTDGDGLSDGEEVLRAHTDPLKADTDGDTVSDGADRCPLVAGDAAHGGCPAPPKPGTVTNFPSIYFQVNSDEFDFTRPETTDNLVRLLQYINQCPELSVIIEGHASREGSEARNQQLSEQRARRVRAWLIEQGVDSNKIEATFGYGSSRNAVEEPAPGSLEARSMDPERLEEIRRQNRRIAVVVARTCR